MSYSKNDYLKDFAAVNDELVREGVLDPEEVAIIRRFLGLDPTDADRAA